MSCLLWHWAFYWAFYMVLLGGVRTVPCHRCTVRAGGRAGGQAGGGQLEASWAQQGVAMLGSSGLQPDNLSQSHSSTLSGAAHSKKALGITIPQ